VSKFVGKFRKNQDYKDDNFDYNRNSNKRRSKAEHSEVKKLKTRRYENLVKMYDEEGNYKY
jgi:hypothetical protein